MNDQFANISQENHNGFITFRNTKNRYIIDRKKKKN